MRRLRAVLQIDAFRLALSTGLLFASLHLLDGASLGRGFALPVVSRFEHAAQDYVLTRLRGPRAPSGQVVVVAVDERAVEAEGIWPWSRAKMARLVDALAGAGVAAVGFDVAWTEDDVPGRRLAKVASLVKAARDGAPDPATARRLDEAWAAAGGADRGEAVEVDPTEQLADAIERAHRVTVGFMFLSGPDADPALQADRVGKLRFLSTGPIHVPRGGRLVPVDGATPLARFPGVAAPVEDVLSVADSGGYLTVRPDPDGVIRRYPVVASAGGAIFPALGVAVLARAYGEDGRPAAVMPVGAAGAPEALQEVRVGPAVVETDDAGRAPLDYYGPYRDYPHVSATDLLHGRLAPGALRGKLALVGTTAAGTWDARVTPFDEAAPGVIVHATFVENVLRGELLRRTPAVLAVEVLLMIALAVGLARVLARASSLAAAPAVLAAAGGWTVVAVLALRRGNVVLALGMPVAQVLAMFVVATTYRFFWEERARRRARETFGRFLSPAVVDSLLAEGGAPRLGGEKRELTALFGDVRGFTRLSERLDPHLLLELLNELLAPMTDVIVSGHQGTLDKYMGDAIMAFWGAPAAQPDHALRACRAALAMLERLDGVRARWRERGLPGLDVGIGINTGLMSVGFVGSEDRFYNYTVLGDAVNLASRLEGANKEYGTRILIGPETRAAVGDAVVARELDRVRVKGKRDPVRIHELLAMAPATPELARFLEAFARGLSAYRSRRWDEAIAGFREADRLRGGDPPSLVYVARCEAMRGAPPGPEWDGVFDLKTK